MIYNTFIAPRIGHIAQSVAGIGEGVYGNGPGALGCNFKAHRAGDKSVILTVNQENWNI